MNSLDKATQTHETAIAEPKDICFVQQVSTEKSATTAADPVSQQQVTPAGEQVKCVRVFVAHNSGRICNMGYLDLRDTDKLKDIKPYVIKGFKNVLKYKLETIEGIPFENEEETLASCTGGRTVADGSLMPLTEATYHSIMAPRKAATRTAAAGRSRATADQSHGESGAETPALAPAPAPTGLVRKTRAQTKATEEQPSTPRSSRAQLAGVSTPNAASSRMIFTPIAGRKYTRGMIDMAQTPKRATMDPMRITVAKTPYTARRGIAEYEAEKDPIRTYLRLRPGRSNSLLQLANDKEVELVHNDDELRARYLFSGVLPSLAQQARVFQVCALPAVHDLFMGFNTLVFAYGASNSGKTHTVQGSAASPGLLPRSIQAILQVLDAHDAQGDFSVRPRYATQVEGCTDPRITRPTFRIAPGEDAWVSGLLAEESMGDTSHVEELAKELQDADNGGDWVYQLYASYVEVYNEAVYDLLDLTTLTTVHVRGAAEPAPRPLRRAANGRKKRATGVDDADSLHMSAAQISALSRTPLLLRSEGGRGGDAFVDGATEVRVRNARDLVRVLIHGKLRRAVHATGLNAGSSRSHAVFQARLVKIHRNATIPEQGTVAEASVRTMTVVDLAGSERAKRTHNMGDRLAEAGKINVGLMTLKKCLDVKRFNATLSPGDPNIQLVPYNESKVTRLFQPALEGGARTAMVVCVDPYDHSGDDTGAAYAELKNVLDFARVASELVTFVRRVEDPMPLQKMQLESDNSEDVEDEDEDEIFFDTAATRKRPGSSSDVDVDVTAQTDTAHSTAAKRQRNGITGEWQNLGQAQAAVPPTPRNRSRAVPIKRPPVSAQNGHTFTFEKQPVQPLNLSGALAATTDYQREIQRLQAMVASMERQLSQQRKLPDETEELIVYADALESALDDVRAKYIACQERVLRIEEETRAEVSAFFMSKINEVKSASAERLQDELVRSETKAAHKIDILSRLRTVRSSYSDSEDEDDSRVDAAQVPTVSPRTAVRRAVSRAASKKANKVTSVSAGENRELGHLRSVVQTMEAQASSMATQLEMVNQARSADRATKEALENALIEANGRAAQLEAKLIRLSSEHSPETELALMRAHERERAEFVAQISMLRAQLRDSEAYALKSRRQWESQELVPLQEKLRVLLASKQKQRPRGGDVEAIESLENAERERDDAWVWWTKEQQRNTQLCAQNDVLMREIRHLRMQLGSSVEQESYVDDEEDDRDSMDSDGSYCKVSLTSADAVSAINGGNPLGASTLGISPPSQSSSAAGQGSQQGLLTRGLSKNRLVLQRKPTSSYFSPRESSESFANSVVNSQMPGSRQHAKLEGAKRVVSRVFNHFTPESKRNDPLRAPYMSGRFANTDTAVGSYSAEVVSYEAAPGRRARGNTVGEEGSERQEAKVRSIVYSGPIVAHPTGGVSVTFTSEEVHDLPIVSEETIMEDDENEDAADEEDHYKDGGDETPDDADDGDGDGNDGNESGSAQGTKRSRSMMRRPGMPKQPSVKQEAGSPNELANPRPDPNDIFSSTDTAHAPEQRSKGLMASVYGSTAPLSSDSLPPQSMSTTDLVSAAAVKKKKRRLHTGRTVMNVGSGGSDYDEDHPGTPIPGTSTPGASSLIAGSWPPVSASTPSIATPSANMQAKQEAGKPMLYTPVKSKVKPNGSDFSPPPSTPPMNAGDKADNIFLTPIKMLSRLRNRKK
ncbi:hypothetical protein GGI07_005541 [Coemansia sp. Benny D115]|nr:hypothetical protein GGI07_005541 [Coemansia sp. Benny D115]